LSARAIPTAVCVLEVPYRSIVSPAASGVRTASFPFSASLSMPARPSGPDAAARAASSAALAMAAKTAGRWDERERRLPPHRARHHRPIVLRAQWTTG